jgi:hypothetical protein
VWILSQIHFGNHKSSLYYPETRYGIEFQLPSPETLIQQAFQGIWLRDTDDF